MKITKSELKEMIREALREELSGSSTASDIIQKIAIYKAVNIKPEQGKKQYYKDLLTITTSWSDLQKILDNELTTLKEEIIEYGDIDNPYNGLTYDLTDPSEAAEYAAAKKELDDYFLPNWLEIKASIDTAKSGTSIDIFEIDYDDFNVSWEGVIIYFITVL